ncbi:MAG: IPT/TIG domain-containing protein, partial [Bacteroidota bacterium]
MKVILRNLLLLTVLWTLVQCEDEDLESRDFPRLNTLEVSEITPEGAKFSAEITVRGGYDLVRFGFVWGEEENPEIESNDRVIYSVNIRSNTFSEKIETTLKDRTTYFVRAFVETEDYLVYGANVSFVSMGSKAPHINTFSPLVGTIGDTVTLSGINFSYVAEQNIVQFDSLDATVTFASDTLLEVIVPLALTAEDPEVFVSIFGNRTVAVNRFQLSTPQIDLFSPQEATDNDELIIAGSGFAHFSELNQVEIGDKEAAVVSASKKQLVVAVPSGIATRESNLKVTVAGQSTIADTPFSLRAPNVTDFQPKQASIRQLVTIEGEHFSTVIDGNEVYFDTAQARIAEVSATSLVVEVPYGVPVNAIIKVITAGQEASASGRFQIQQPVIDVINPLRASSGKIVSLTGDNFSPRDEDNEVFFNGISATILSSSKTRLSVSVPTGINQRSVEIVANTGGHESAPVPFEHVDGQWTQRSTFPGGERPGAIMERIDNSIYFGLGVDFRTPVNEFWKYNIILGGWTRLEDFPGEARMDASSFVINGKLYVGMGRGASRQDEELA